ncbi:MAG: hypothetical protein WAM13_05060, partial [Candidatus Sulfotelmatobacter sp.]
SQRYQRGMEMVLDIQDLQQGREPWSKAKQPDSAGGALPSPSATGRLSSPGPLAAAASPRASKLQRGVAEKLLAAMRNSSLAAILLVVGVLVIGLRVGPVALHPGVLPPDAIQKTPPGIPDLSRLKPKSDPVDGGRHSASRTPASLLEIEVDHKFVDAHLSIWVDDSLTYTHPLEGIEKRHLIMFHQVEGHEFHAVQIPPGKHLLKVRITSSGGLSDQTATIRGKFAGGKEAKLRINFDNSGTMNLSLQ